MNNKKNSRLLLIFFLVLVIIIGLIFANRKNFQISYYSKMSGYKKTTINTFMDNDKYDVISKHKYSKLLDEIVNTKYYNDKYINEYLLIKYIEQDGYLENISKMLDIGYDAKEINTIYEKLGNKGINYIKDNSYINDLIGLISIDYFREDNIDRYVKYKNNNKDMLDSDIVLKVNIGLDNKYYTNVIEIDESDKLDTIVNKYHRLSSSYSPNDLVQVKYGSGTLRKEAAEHFNKMCDDALKNGILIYGGSGYRSYSHQTSLYNNYVAEDGFDNAERYSARPGYSEHQLGLAMDILNKNWQFISKNDEEYTWLVNNSYKYGFILRYPEGKENITGYMYEEWHFRYFGLELAKELYDKKLIYEEYLAMK